MRVHANGKARDYVLGPTGSEPARREYARILAELAAGETGATKGTPLFCAEVALRYLRFVEQRYDRSHYHRMRAALEPLVRLYGHVQAARFGPASLRTCRQEWVKKGHARVYCNALLRSVKACWSWAVAEEYLGEAHYRALTHVHGLREGETEAPEREPVTGVAPAIVEATLPFLPAQVADMARLQLFTGARPGEVCVLRPADIDRDWLKVDSIPVWLYSLKKHKTRWRGHRRYIALGPKAQALLAAYLERRQAKDYIFDPRDARCASAFPPDRQPGSHYSTASYGCAVRRACERGKIEPWSPNQIRHEVGTSALLVGDQDLARCVLGHRTPKLTAVYTEDAKKAAVFAAKMG